VIFDEQASWNWENSSLDGGGIGIEYHTLELGEPQGAPVFAAGSPSPMPTALTPEPVTPVHIVTPAPASPPPQPEFVSPPPNAEDYLDVNVDGIEHRYHRIHDILEAATPPGQAACQVAAALHLQIVDEPNTFAKAEHHQQWCSAMIEEIDSIMSNKTWRLVPLPPGHHPIGLNWVFKLKKNVAGEVIKHKARLVAKDYVQQQGMDFDEVFAPIARIESVRLLLALAAQEGWPVHHMDMKSAFLNGELAEEVYVYQPPGFIVDGQEDKVLRLDKALYGLRQAPHAWNAKLDETLVALGFSNSVSEHVVYAHGEGASRLLVGVYIDDLIIARNNNIEIASFKQQMSSRFKMSDLGLLSFYLGIEVKQGSDGISL
jgi:hypothetical protein